MRMDFQRKVMFSCRSRSAEFQMTSFLAEAELRKFKSQTRRQVLVYKSVTLKYVGHENAGYIKFSVFA